MKDTEGSIEHPNDSRALFGGTLEPSPRKRGRQLNLLGSTGRCTVHLRGRSDSRPPGKAGGHDCLGQSHWLARVLCIEVTRDELSRATTHIRPRHGFTSYLLPMLRVTLLTCTVPRHGRDTAKVNLCAAHHTCPQCNQLVGDGNKAGANVPRQRVLTHRKSPELQCSSPERVAW